MGVQKHKRIYHLGSLPPFLLLFAGNIKGVDHRWNQHWLGGDNLEGKCRSLHPGPISLLHWSGKGKPWLRLDSRKPCNVDHLWASYDLFRSSSLTLEAYKMKESKEDEMREEEKSRQSNFLKAENQFQQIDIIKEKWFPLPCF